MSLEVAFEIGRVGLDIKRIADVLTGQNKDVFVELPGLLAYFPSGIRDTAGNVVNHAGGAGQLEEVGACPVGYDGDAYIQNSATSYLDSVGGSAFEVTGLETYIEASIRGLTVGGWVNLTTLPSSNGGIFGRDGGAVDRGYGLFSTSAGVISFFVSLTGAVTVSAVGGTIGTDAWHFVVGRFTPSTEVAVFVDGEKDVNVTGVPASINIPTPDFQVGRFFDADSTRLHFKWRDLFICAATLDDVLLENIRISTEHV